MTGDTIEQVGIVGAGLSGATTAYYLAEERPDVEITVFERSDSVGGRLRTMSVGDRTFEACGKFLHPGDTFSAGLVDELGLGRADPADVNGSEPPAMGREKTIGIWDGETFRVNLEGSMLGSVGHLLGSYPLSLYRLLDGVSDLESHVETLAEQLESGASFRTTDELITATGIEEYCRRSGREYLRAAGVDRQSIDELVAATAGTTFGQGPDIHAFAALYAVHSMSPGGGDPFAVEGGNATLVESLLEASGATVSTGTTVAEITREDNGDGYKLRHEDGTASVDAAVLATPFETTDIELTAVEAPPSRPFHITHLTFVLGDLDTSYFGTESIPDFVTTADEPGVPFTFLYSLGSVGGRDGTLYELDTDEKPDDDLLSSLFDDYEVVDSTAWQGFPAFDPDVARPPFELAEGLYYPSAIESIVTTMEFSAMAGRNTATLLAEAGAD